MMLIERKHGNASRWTIVAAFATERGARDYARTQSMADPFVVFFRVRNSATNKVIAVYRGGRLVSHGAKYGW